MTLRAIIKKLIDVDIHTDDLNRLKEHPASYVSTKQDEKKLRQLFLLLELAKESEVERGSLK